MLMASLESRIKKEILGAKDMGYAILFPDARKFEDIFQSATPVRPGESFRSSIVHTWTVDELFWDGKVRKDTGRAELDSFCSVWCSPEQSYNHLSIVPKPEIIQMIGSQMLLCDQYRINFQINIRDEKKGTALVSAHYNMICGSRWFAIIDASTIPK